MNSYFSHDSNARSDEKILALRMKHNWEGYGLYWALIEKLRDSPCYTLTLDYNLVAWDLRADASLIKSIIHDFGLFAFTDDGKCFYSESLMKRMEVKDELRQKKSEAAKARWAKAKVEVSAPAMQAECSCTDPDMQLQSTCINESLQLQSNKSKGKNSKVNKGKEGEGVIPRVRDDASCDDTSCADPVSGPSPPARSPAFQEFQAFILRHAPRVAEMKEPFTEQQFGWMTRDFRPPLIKTVVTEMHNYGDLFKNVNAYITFKKFVKQIQRR